MKEEMSDADSAVEPRVEYIGVSRAPVAIIDGLAPDPAALVDCAAAIQPAFAATSRFYPGIRAPAPEHYAKAIKPLLAAVVDTTFGACEVEILESNFSLVTTPATNLVPFQRIPHVDGTDANIIAVLHYLCSAEHGGTSFYRHRRTGCEQLTSDNIADYMRAVNAEVQEFGMPASRYVDGDTPMFERIARFEASFNRALLYSGAMLHSGNIPADFIPNADPRIGRLTVNTFIKLHPRP